MTLTTAMGSSTTMSSQGTVTLGMDATISSGVDSSNDYETSTDSASYSTAGNNNRTLSYQATTIGPNTIDSGPVGTSSSFSTTYRVFGESGGEIQRSATPQPSRSGPMAR